MAATILNNVLSWQVDTASIAAAQAANNAVASSLQDVSAQAQSVAMQMAQAGASAQEIFDATGETIDTSLIAPLDAADTSVQNLIHDIGDLGKDIQAIPEPDLSAFGVADDEASSDSGGGSGYGNTRALRGLGTLAGGQVGGGIRDVANIARLASVFGPMGAAAGVLALGLNAVTQSEQAAAKAAQDYVDKLAQIQQQIAGGETGGQIQDQINKLESQKKAQDDVVQSLSKINDQFQAATKQYSLSDPSKRLSDSGYTNTILGLNAALQKLTGDTSITTNNLGKALDDEKTKSSDTAASIGLLNAQLDSAPVLANNFTQGLAILQKDGLAIVDAATKQLTQSQVAQAQSEISAQQMTKQQRADKIQQDLEDEAVLNAEMQQAGLTSDTHLQLTKQYNDLQKEVSILSSTTNSYADQLAAENDAKQKATDAASKYLDAITAEDDAIQKVNQAQQAISQAQTDYQAKVAQDTAQFQQTQVEDQAKYYQKLAQISQQANLDEEQAVGDRDALANYRAHEKQAQDDADTTAQYQLQSQQQAAHNAQTLQADLQAYQKQNAQLVQNLNNAQVDQSRAAGEALGYQKQQQTAELNQSLQHWNAMYSIADTYLKPIENRFAQAFQNMYNSITGAGPDIGFTPPLKPGNALGSSSPGSYSPLPAPTVKQVRDIVDSRVAQMMSQASI